jgi:glutamate-1-semialdehyde 2,1-aminomutase
LSAIESVAKDGLLSPIGPTELDYKYAEMIRKANPCAEKIRVTTSGTEAVMYATRLARAYTKKNKIAKFEGQYSGSSDFTYFSVTPPEDAPLPPKSILDTEGIPNEVTKYQVSLPWNDIYTTENIIKRERKNLAAIIVDPCMRAIAPPEKDFLKALREITSENDILLIVDEVVSGFRLSYKGAYGYFGVVPDIVVYGKIAGGGFPIGVFASNEEIMSLVSSERGKARVPHSGTFSGHPFAIAAGYSALCELYEHPEIYDRINMFGDKIRKSLLEIFEEKKVNAIICGYASIFRIFFTEKRVIKNYRDIIDSGKRLEEAFRLELISRGVYTSLWSNLSAAITEEDVKLTLRAAADAIEAVG